MKQERILIAEDYNNQLSSNFYFAITTGAIKSHRF